ncbi:MAG TPA: PadR family transcriptional regulator [Mycobacterium sp.]|nr:PadR family transcriptional regulator [Mycobacterium sp.]
MPSRFFRHGELPLAVLAMLAQRPMHGYELMAELSRVFPGYPASPGSVYPAVEALETEGLLLGETRDGKTIYKTTVAGDRALAARSEMLAALEVRTGARLSLNDSLEPVLARFRARVMPLSGRADPDTVADVLDRAAGEIEALAEVPKIKRLKGVAG